MLLGLGMLLMLACWYVTLFRWQYGMAMLLAYLPFAGVVTFALAPSPLPVLFKDFFFIIPAYLAFWLRRKEGMPEGRVPSAVRMTMLALAFMVCLQSLNPGLASWLVAAIGAKVWLFYLPLLFLAFEMIGSRDDLLRVLRLMVVITWIPCSIGILEWLASMAFGYVETMYAIYGDAADAATQHFAYFDVGGEVFRIPSTFTFVAQYFGFTLSMLVPSYALTKLDDSAAWRSFALLTLGVAMLASFMSGARAAFLFVPLLLLLIYWLEGRFRGAVKVSLMVAPMLLLALYVTGIDPLRLYSMMSDLFVNYSDNIAKQGLLDAIANSPFGTGTGMNTGPARYALDVPDDFIGIENYYAKAVIELGIPGLLIVAGLFLTLARYGHGIHSRLRDPGLRSCSSALLAFVIMIALNSFKGWQIDLDPVNVYFWMFAGFMLKLGYLDRIEPVPATTAAEAERTRGEVRGSISGRA